MSPTGVRVERQVADSPSKIDDARQKLKAGSEFGSCPRPPPSSRLGARELRQIGGDARASSRRRSRMRCSRSTSTSTRSTLSERGRSWLSTYRSREADANGDRSIDRAGSFGDARKCGVWLSDANTLRARSPRGTLNKLAGGAFGQEQRAHDWRGLELEPTPNERRSPTERASADGGSLPPLLICLRSSHNNTDQLDRSLTVPTACRCWAAVRDGVPHSSKLDVTIQPWSQTACLYGSYV